MTNLISPLGLVPMLDGRTRREVGLTWFPNLFDRDRTTTLLASNEAWARLTGRGFTNSNPGAGLISLFAQRPLDKLLEDDLSGV